MIEQALETIGLTEGEIQVYTALIELGTSKTGAITKRANVASSKVYEVLQRLANKGLVSHVIKDGVRYYDATPPERLIDFLEDKKNAISRSQETIRKIIPAIKAKQKESKQNSTVVYSGKQGPIIALREVLDEVIKGNEVLGFGTDRDDYLEQYPAELNKFFNTAKKHKTKQRLLFGEGFISPNKQAKVRYLSQEFLSPVRTMIYGNKVALVDFTKPITTIVIDKKEISDAYRRQFEILWNIAGAKTKI